ncbi:hypothetical protein Goshw_029799, partial [Gossypium schwendimanii]|nr:hypothetical protein [Gossypium schwendimanii]
DSTLVGILQSNTKFPKYCDVVDQNFGNARVRGQFARMVVYVNLDEPLVSQILVNGKIQRIEYEFLPTRTRTYERLDYALANDSWISTFPHCLVSHLLRIKFDHMPILLKTNLAFYLSIGRPFKLISRWTKHANFSHFVKDKWNFS